MRDGYVIAGWVAAFSGIGMYAYRTIIRSRQVAARLLAIENAEQGIVHGDSAGSTSS